MPRRILSGTSPPCPRTSRLRRSASALWVFVACSTPRDSSPSSTDTGATPESVSARRPQPAPGFPGVGVAVRHSAHAWCGTFPRDSAAADPSVGEPVSIVFAGPNGVPARAARVVARRASPCPSAFPQPRWIDYVAYDIALADSVRPEPDDTPTVALAVRSAAPWSRGADGTTRADLDGDGLPEEARRCTADEGEHFTIFSHGADGRRIRRAHEYYDWGAFTDRTCGPGEDGRNP